MNSSRQYCTFTLDDYHFGVPVEHVREVLRYQPMTSVPLAPREVRGLINRRGQIVTVIDLRRRLGLPDLNPPRGTNVFVQLGDELVSLLVDEIGVVQAVEESQFEPPPATLRGAGKELITGAYKLADKLLLVLDVGQAAVLNQRGIKR